MEKPTDHELEMARDVLEWFVEKTRRDEPYAVNSIAAWEAALDQLPVTMDDIS